MIVRSGTTPRYQPTPAEVERLREQGNRHRPLAGVRLTPTTGQPATSVRKVREYLGGMVERLAGAALKSANKHIVPTIYSSDDIKVFVEPAGPDAFELGVTTGTLRKLRHEEELAFLVAHEVSRALAGEASTPETSWLRPQATETVYDHHALDMMVTARYNPEGALSALNHLYADHAPTSSSDIHSWTRGGLLHHHEGVRISLDQAKLEMMRRYQPAARISTPLTPLPDSVRLRTPQRTEPRETGAAYGRAVQDVATAFLKNDPAVPSLEHFNPHPHQVASAFDQAFRHLAKADATPQAKVDATLRLMHRLSLGHTAFKPDDQTIQDLSMFMLRASTAKADPWKAASFITSNAEHNATFATNVLMNPTLEPVFAPLRKVDAQWRELIDATPQLLLHGEVSAPASWTGFSHHVRTLAQRQAPGPLDATHKRNVLGLLDRAPLAEMAAQTTARGDLSFFREWKPVLFAPTTPFDHIFADAVRQSLQPGVEVFRQFRERAVLEHLQSGSPETISRSLGDFFSSDVALPISEAFEQKLAPPLDGFVRDANTKPDYFYGAGLTPLDNHLELGRLLTRKPDAAAMTFMASHHEYIMPLPKHGPATEVLGTVSQHLAASDPEAFVRDVETRTPQYDRSLSEALGARLGLENVPSDTAGLGKLLDDIESAAFPPSTAATPTPSAVAPGSPRKSATDNSRRWRSSAMIPRRRRHWRTRCRSRIYSACWTRGSRRSSAIRSSTTWSSGRPRAFRLAPTRVSSCSMCCCRNSTSRRRSKRGTRPPASCSTPTPRSSMGARSRAIGSRSTSCRNCKSCRRPISRSGWAANG